MFGLYIVGTMTTTLVMHRSLQPTQDYAQRCLVLYSLIFAEIGCGCGKVVLGNRSESATYKACTLTIVLPT